MVFDLDGSGAIESQELLHLGKMRRKLGQKEGDWSEARNSALIEKMDSNLDGKIDAMQFSNHFEKALPKDMTGFQTVIDQFLAVAKECRTVKVKKKETAQADAAKKKAEFEAKQMARAEEKIKKGESPESKPSRAASRTPKATPTQATSAKATPTKATPTKATPTKATPTKATPTKATPTKARAVEPLPGRSNPSKPSTPAPSRDDKKERFAQLNAVFAVFDLDKSGVIESRELLQLGKMRRQLGQKTGDWSDEQNARLVKKMDVNRDGKTSDVEFSTHFEKSLTKDMKEFLVVIDQFMAVAKACRAAKKNAPHKCKFERLAKLDDVFALLDLDGGGLLESGEILQLGKMRHNMKLKPGLWCEDQNSMLVHRMDKDNDGKINGLEFSTHFERVLPRDMKGFQKAIDEYMEVAQACRETDSYTIYSRIRAIKNPSGSKWMQFH